jgi:hypothetical protein
MSVIYNGTLRNTRLQDVVNAIDAGAGNGVLRLLAGGNIVSSLALPKPSGTVANQILTFSGLSLIDPSAVGGTATSARIEDSAGNIVISGLTVGTAGTDIVLSPTNVIGAGQAVAIQSATISGN